MTCRRYQIFPVEKEHKCDGKCLMFAEKCYEYSRLIFPSDLLTIIESNLSLIDQKPRLVNDNFFFLKIEYPASVPLVKLVNINGRDIKLKTVIGEFLLFLEEIYAVESFTIPEEKIIIECTSCISLNFDSFEKKIENSNCPICSEEVSSQIIFECSHSACEKCLTNWFKEKNTCPYCRRPLIPCDCNGQRETEMTMKPAIEDFIAINSISTGIYKLYPYNIDELQFTAIVYDSETNVFSLRAKNLYI